MRNVLGTRHRALLREVPTWALQEELARRDGHAAEIAAPSASVRGFFIDPIANLVRWRGDTYEVGGRQAEMLYALALARKRGRRRVPAAWLAVTVFRGFTQETADTNVRQTLHDLGQRFPGLLLMSGNRRLGYGLNLDDDEEASA